MKKALLAATVVASTLTASLVAAPAATAAGWDSPRDGRHQNRSAIPFTEASVTAGADGAFTLRWSARGTGHVEIRANGKVVAQGGSRGRTVVRGLPAADRQWFDFKPERGQGLRLADRLVRLEGTANFRDAGGYRTTDGQWVKMGEIYRSDALAKLTDNVFDLRMTDERTKDVDRVPVGAKYVVADVFAGYDEVRAAYGSFDRYLDKGLGIDRRELRELREDLLVG
ncbi:MULTISPECIES: tyrosine-protein phosphatase [unclassified Streptomyces]|uniref:tyrosine-protein phosphatase n=1 Tax=unclassified Streptomyces TaxID=2593676 RepID=UPI00226F0949|nr:MULTISPECIES: tyrosine-protein phosphatase [unclassified Streptomyces]MCY0916837.1 tyrosine-protein phosphatase [Streptomyces sp. H27-G5]MCY0957995.1 tyrosine-protein phosphatase [Streptomyces sp. H27-H5]